MTFIRRLGAAAGSVLLIAAPARAVAPGDSTRADVSPVQRLVQRESVVGSPGHARALPGSAHFLGPDVLGFQDQSFDDPHRLMLRIPGVYALGEDGFGLRPNIGMRGVDPYRSAGILVLEDGVPASPAPYAAPGLFVFGGLGRAESIESLKGPGAVPYGPRTGGGVLNVATLPAPDDLVGRARLSLGSNEAHTLHADYGDAWRGASWILGTHQTRTDGFKALDGGGETGFEHDDYLGKLRLRTPTGAALYQDVLFKFGYYETDARDSYLGLSDADFDATPYRRYAASRQDRMQHDATQLLLRHFVAVNDAIDVTTSLYRNDVELDWYLLQEVNGEDPADVLADPASYGDAYGVLTGDSVSADDALAVKSNRRSYFAGGVQSVLGLDATTGGARHAIETGLRFHQDEEDRLHRIDGYRMQAGGAMVLTSRGEDGGDGGTDNQVNEATSLAWFARDRISVGDWSFTPGLRIDRVETTQSSYAAGDAARAAPSSVVENTTTAVLPGVGVTYRPAPELTLLGGIHTGFTPAPAGVGGDGYRTYHYEFGGRAKRGGMDAALIGFLTDHDLAGDGPGVRAWGLEASAGYAIHDPLYGIAMEASYALNLAEFRRSGTPLDAPWGAYATGDEVPYVPTHSVTGSLVLTTGRSYAGVAANFASRARSEPGTGDFVAAQTVDDRFLLDIVTEFEVFPRVRVFASVYNTTDAVYVASRFPYGAHPGAPRTFTAGLKLDLERRD